MYEGLFLTSKKQYTTNGDILTNKFSTEIILLTLKHIMNN